MEYHLDAELLELESQLAALVPSAVPSEMFVAMQQTLGDAVESESSAHDAELEDLETHLGQLAPAGLSVDMISRMAIAMDRWHEYVPVEEKVVPFGTQDSAPVNKLGEKKAKRSSAYGMYAAAAAVALLGAVTALVMPHLDSAAPASAGTVADSGNEKIFTPANTQPDSRSVHAVDVSNAPRDAWMVPNSLSHMVTNTSDTGVLITRDNVPHRSIRIDYVDRLKVLDEDGREIEINRPGVQYVLIPVQTN
ncbi:hypothetical protein [Oceaniferula spumae]